MKYLRRSFLFAVLILCLPTVFYGQNTKNADSSPAAATPMGQTTPAPKTPTEFFARARQLSDLEAAGVPFHLKIAFKATGKTEFTGDGVYEEWWESKNVWRKEATLGKYKHVAVHNGQEKAASATSAYIPLRVRQVEGFKILNISLPAGDKDASWKVTEMKVHGVSVDIVGLRKQFEPKFDSSMFSVHEYSFNQEGLLAGYRKDDLFESFTDFRSFGNSQFPRTMTLALLGQPLLTAHVAVLEKLTDPTETLFDPNSVPDLGNDESAWMDSPKLANGGVTAPKLTHSVDPQYPRSERNVSSSVLVQCVIDRAGKVREPFVLLSGGEAFDDAAVEAVRKYRFKPATKDKKPVMVLIKVMVVFHGDDE